MARKSLDDRIEELLEQLDEIDPSDTDAQIHLDALRKKIENLGDRARALRDKCEALEQDASEHEERAEDIAEEADALESRYRFAIRMLELGYGISEHDLDLVSGSTPEDAFRKLTSTARRAIAQGSADPHGGCAYVGACIPYQTGLVGAPCGAGQTSPASKGRFAPGGGGAAKVKNPVLHASCVPGFCVPAYAGWIPIGESCS